MGSLAKRHGSLLLGSFLAALGGCTAAEECSIVDRDVPPPAIPCAWQGDKGLRQDAFSFEGTVVGATYDTFFGAGCGGDANVPDTIFFVNTGSEEWRVVLDFQVDVSVGDSISFTHTVESDGTTPFGLVDTFELRTAEGDLLAWDGAWTDGPSPRAPAEVSRLQPASGFDVCTSPGCTEVRLRGFDVTLDGVSANLPFRSRRSIGDYDAVGGAIQFAKCTGGERDTAAQRLAFARRRSLP